MSASSPSTMSSILHKDRAFVIGGLTLLVILSWAYLLNLANSMHGGMAMAAAMPNMMPWSHLDWISMLVMWSVMMIGMMLPSAAPMLLVFTKIHRKKRENNRPYVATGVFLAGYIIIWTAFSVLATIGNWVLHTNALLSGMMGQSTTALLGGSLLLAAGIFQWTPFKNTCLNHCRTPISFIMTEWKEGALGALLMGLKHGAFCLGCCWLLMALLFVLGVMNLLWIAALAIFVLIEKVVPQGIWISRISGLGLIGWGGLVLSQMIP